jgi:hypothetical protein
MATWEMGGKLKKEGRRVISHTRMEGSLGDTLHTAADDTWIIVLNRADSVLIFPRYLSVCVPHHTQLVNACADATRHAHDQRHGTRNSEDERGGTVECQR